MVASFQVVIVYYVRLIVLCMLVENSAFNNIYCQAIPMLCANETCRVALPFIVCNCLFMRNVICFYF
jgi:hypothetical protein